MGDWKSSAAVAIIGGGIMGASTAYHLARRGCTDVVILEKEFLAQASTGLSAGGIRQQFSHPANIRLSQEAVRLFERFEEEFGVDINFRQVGYLFLAQSEATWQEFLTNVEVQRASNVPVEVLTPDEIKYRWPYLAVDDLQRRHLWAEGRLCRSLLGGDGLCHRRPANGRAHRGADPGHRHSDRGRPGAGSRDDTGAGLGTGRGQRGRGMGRTGGQDGRF